MTDLELILMMPVACIVGHLLGFGFVALLYRLDARSRTRPVKSRVAPPAASRGDRPSLP